MQLFYFLYQSKSNNYYIQCTRVLDSTANWSSHSVYCNEDPAQGFYTYTGHSFSVYFDSNIKIDSVTYINHIVASYSNGEYSTITFSFYTDKNILDYFNYQTGYPKYPYRLMYSIYSGPSDPSVIFYDTLTINNKKYYNVNKIYQSQIIGKPYVDTLFYNNQVGFIKFNIKNNEYILQ